MAAFEEDLVECAVNAMNEVFGAEFTALDTPYMSVVELVFAQLRNDKPYEISADFIMELGNAFLFAKAARLVKELN